METDLTKYVYDKMLYEAKNYQWRVVFDSHKRALEIYFTITLEADKAQYVQDINGNINRSEILHFEEIVCFYDQNAKRILPDNYLFAVPFDAKSGIEQGQVDAFLKQLNILVSSTGSQLREFLLDASQPEFSMTWNESNMKNTLETMRSTGHYARNRLTFLQEEKQSLVDQFKEEQYDGLERI